MRFGMEKTIHKFFQGIDSLSRNWIAVIERGAVDESEI